MTETFNTRKPYVIELERIFPNIKAHREIPGFGEPDWKIISLVTGRYFEKPVVVLTERSEEEFEEIKISLDDHGILFDRIETKPQKNPEQK